MHEEITIAAWEGLAIYGLGLTIGFFIGFAVRWAMEKPVEVDRSDFTASGETTC